MTLRLFTGTLFSLSLSIGTLFNASTAFASPFDNPDVWKNEGVFNPLTPFSSHDWNPESYQTFAKEFDKWAINMGQSYYQMEDDSVATFQQKTFDQILDDATIDGYNVGFTYKNQDFRSDWDSYRVDIFAMYASDIPLDKHLYIFGIDQDGQDIVLYLDGDLVKKGDHRFQKTENKDLKGLYHQVFKNNLTN